MILKGKVPRVRGAAVCWTVVHAVVAYFTDPDRLKFEFAHAPRR